jgi:RND family efflux transporter MFP subunit
MGGTLLRILLVLVVVAFAADGFGQSSGKKDAWKSGPAPVATDDKSDEAAGPPVRGIEATIINPHRSANVGSQVAAQIKEVLFQEGEFIKEGAVVVRLFDERYKDIADKTVAKIAGLELELKQAENEARVLGELYALKASTQQDLQKSKAQAEITKARLEEAKKELELAKRDLDACTIKAPFSGYMAIRYKQAYESADRLENLFSLVDSSKVYAVANVDESLLDRYQKGMRAVFVHRTGKKIDGEIERVGSMIDPKSKTKRVYCLIDNTGADLEVGMTGSLGRER